MRVSVSTYFRFVILCFGIFPFRHFSLSTFFLSTFFPFDIFLSTFLPYFFSLSTFFLSTFLLHTVCSVKNISIPSIDGTIRDIKVGCSATPAYKTKKCQEHLLTDENDETSYSNNNLVRTHPYRRARRRSQQFRFNL